MMSLLSAVPIYLPWFIDLHACGLTAFGTYLLFKSPRAGKPAGHTPGLGVATVAFGISYLFTSYVPIEENQFLHATVPARLILAGLLIGTGLTPADKQSLLTLGIYDGIGGVVLGLWLGKWDGRVPMLGS
jgi:hypothetical protein